MNVHPGAKLCLAFLLTLGNSASLAATACGSVTAQHAHPPLSLGDGKICFVLRPVTDEQGRALESEGPEIVLYWGERDTPAVIVGELPYFATTGRVEDAFVMDVDRNDQPDVVVIHSADVRSLTGTDEPMYSVIVFTQTAGTLGLNERVSDWFGSGRNTRKPGGGFDEFRYPFQCREAIQAAATTSLFQLALGQSRLSGAVRANSDLYREPALQGRTDMTLVRGDRVTVTRAHAGWCEMEDSADHKAVGMWLRCSALDF